MSVSDSDSESDSELKFNFKFNFKLKLTRMRRPAGGHFKLNKFRSDLAQKSQFKFNLKLYSLVGTLLSLLSWLWHHDELEVQLFITST